MGLDRPGLHEHRGESGASKDGSVMVTYSADAPFMPKLLYAPGGRHRPGS